MSQSDLYHYSDPETIEKEQEQFYQLIEIHLT